MNVPKRFAQALIEILEAAGVKYIFGHPGEQILPIYDALRESKIEHVLMRHEQGAAHAADAYARISGKFGVCIASAGPGALNLTMGIATAYKDSIPLLILTGDVSTKLKVKDVFQEINTTEVFKPITISSTNIKTPNEGIYKLKEAIMILGSGKKGPIHLSFPRDILEDELKISLDEIEQSFEDKKIPPKIDNKDLEDRVNIAAEIIQKAERPLIIAGSGVFWSNAKEKLLNFAEKYKIPVSTTYPARGIFPDDHPLFLGMIGIRGTEAANFAGKNADVIIALGSRLSERTMAVPVKCKLIQVNLAEKSLKADINIQKDVGDFLDSVMNLKAPDRSKWHHKLGKYSIKHKINTDFDDVPIKPQRAIKEILDAAEDSIIVNDAGSHTTWVTLLQRVKEPGTFVFSGGFAPMGYSLPAAVGASLAEPEKTVVVIVGDGGFQMTLQEMATIVQLNIPVIICLINNNSLGIIRQWQKIYYQKSYQVELQNPDFIKLAESYNMNSKRVNSPLKVYKAVKNALSLKKPYLIEVIVDKEEEIPLPKRSKDLVYVQHIF